MVILPSICYKLLYNAGAGHFFHDLCFWLHVGSKSIKDFWKQILTSCRWVISYSVTNGGSGNANTFLCYLSALVFAIKAVWKFRVIDVSKLYCATCRNQTETHCWKFTDTISTHLMSYMSQILEILVLWLHPVSLLLYGDRWLTRTLWAAGPVSALYL